MPDIAYQAALKRVTVVEELLETWKKDHNLAMLACDTDQLIQEAAELRDPIKRLIISLLRGPQPSTLHDEWVIAHDSGSLLSKVIEMFDDFMVMIGKIHEIGYTLDNLGQFEEAKNELYRLKANLKGAWSLPYEEIVMKAQFGV